MDLAKEAASLGIDMVVMDDGWFGKRNDDNSSLGDWQVNEKKLGGSLAELITRVHNQGVKFGIWIEPEMVNEDSDLYRAHPDWAIQIPGKKPVRSRNQLLLDFSRKEVRDCVFDQMFMPEIFPMIMCLVSMILWSACAAGIRIFCLRDAAVAAADLTQECFIIPRRSGVVTIPMQSTAQGSSTELRFSIRFPQWGRTFRRCRTTRPDG